MKIAMVILLGMTFCLNAYAGKVTCNVNGINYTIEISDAEFRSLGLGARPSARDALDGNSPLQRFCAQIPRPKLNGQYTYLNGQIREQSAEVDAPIGNISSKREVKCYYEENNSTILHCPDGHEYHRQGISRITGRGIVDENREMATRKDDGSPSSSELPPSSISGK